MGVEIKERGGGDAGTSATTSDVEITRNPHQPEGWRQDGIDFFVAPPPRCHYIASSSLRELDAVALATNVMVFMERDTNMMGTAVDHMPVLLGEVSDFLRVRKEGVYVDCTQGSGGHSDEILSQLEGTGQLIALDRDQEALDRARERLGSHSNLQAFHQNFKELPTLLSRLGVGAVDGCLLDLGVSSNQLDSPQRGFSFRLEGPIDMRMDTRQETTAARLLNESSAEELAEIFWRYGEEKAARRIATAIVEHRKSSIFCTTTDLAQIVEKVKGRGPYRIHPATLVFQALRIEVNQELVGLEEFLQQAISLLAPQGRLVVISFHSLEDRIVKTVFRKAAGKCVCFRPAEFCDCPRVEQVRILTGKPVTPSPQEIESNPRARSAKLRAVEKRGLSAED